MQLNKQDISAIGGTVGGTIGGTVGDIAPREGDTGYRDIWVIEINRWENRAYGPKHERLASSAMK